MFNKNIGIPGITIDNTIVLVTSALFADKCGGYLTEPSLIRIERLNATLDSFYTGGFSNIIIIDNTVPENFDISIFVKDQKIRQIGARCTNLSNGLLPNEYSINGPSKLELLLLWDNMEVLKQICKDYAFILKISAGYKVSNLKKIYNLAPNGAVFRMGNPLRIKVKFCLTSFYILPKGAFFKMISFFYTHINKVSAKFPLEALMFDYINTLKVYLTPVPYPKLDAQFLSSGRSSKDFDYLLKERVFILLARLGLFVYTF